MQSVGGFYAFNHRRIAENYAFIYVVPVHFQGVVGLLSWPEHESNSYPTLGDVVKGYSKKRKVAVGSTNHNSLATGNSCSCKKWCPCLGDQRKWDRAMTIIKFQVGVNLT